MWVTCTVVTLVPYFNKRTPLLCLDKQFLATKPLLGSYFTPNSVSQLSLAFITCEQSHRDHQFYLSAQVSLSLGPRGWPGITTSYQNQLWTTSFFTGNVLFWWTCECVCHKIISAYKTMTSMLLHWSLLLCCSQMAAGAGPPGTGVSVLYSVHAVVWCSISTNKQC